MSNVFFLNPQILSLLEQMEENAGEITPEMQEQMDQVLQATPEALERAGFILLHLDAQIAATKERIDSLRGAKDRMEATKARLREALLPVLEAAGGKFKGLEFTLSITTSKKEAFVLAPGHSAFELDPKFFRVKEPELVVAELKAAQKAGQLPPEIDYATHEESTPTLRRAKAKADANPESTAA